jgi:hypothetical protein
MKLPKFLSIVTFITSFSLLYVYQQTEIFRLAYVGQKKQALYQDFLDKNNFLRYNITSRASLAQIGNTISGNPDYEMPNTYRLVRLSPSREGLNFEQQSLGRETIFSRLFGIKRQAEAKTINSQ